MKNNIVHIIFSQGLHLHKIIVYELSENNDVLTPIETRKCDFANLVKEAEEACKAYETNVIKCNHPEIVKYFRQKNYEIL